MIYKPADKVSKYNHLDSMANIFKICDILEDD